MIFYRSCIFIIGSFYIVLQKLFLQLLKSKYFMTSNRFILLLTLHIIALWLRVNKIIATVLSAAGRKRRLSSALVCVHESLWVAIIFRSFARIVNSASHGLYFDANSRWNSCASLFIFILDTSLPIYNLLLQHFFIIIKFILISWFFRSKYNIF